MRLPPLHWLVAAAGFAAIVKLQVDPQPVAILVFVLAAALSFLQPRLAPYWAGLVASAVVVGEALHQYLSSAPSADLMALVAIPLLGIGIAVSGAAAGLNVLGFARR